MFVEFQLSYIFFGYRQMRYEGILRKHELFSCKSFFAQSRTGASIWTGYRVVDWTSVQRCHR